MTARLATLALDNWRAVEGFAVSQNIPPLATLPLDRFCSFMWWYATRNAQKESDVRKFESSLWMPPKGEEAKGPWSPEAETNAFAALKRGVGK